MAVPERAERVSRLLESLGLGPDAVMWDKTHAGHLPTWWRAVELTLAKNTSHVLILEDDAEVCRDLIPSVERLVAAHPDRIFTLYYNVRDADGARAQGLALLPVSYPLSDVAMAYPADWLRELRRDFEKSSDKFADKGADDMRLALRPGYKVWATMPSLVEHGSPFESTLGHRYSRARARWFIGRHRSALAIDWSRT